MDKRFYQLNEKVLQHSHVMKNTCLFSIPNVERENLYQEIVDTNKEC